MRFKHFSDWNQFKLKQLSKIYDGTHQTPDYKDIGVKFVSVEDIKNLYATTKYITKDAFDRDFKISPKQNDVLMTRIGDIGTSALVTKDEPLAYYVSLALIKPYNNLNPQFLKYLIESTNFQHELWKKTIHVAFPKKINKEEIGECRCFIPDIYTQQIIGEFLLLIDNRIETQNKIIKDLKELKKSICYSINLLGNIENKTVGEVCKIGRGRVISQREIEKQTNPIYPVYSSQTLNNGIMGYLDSYDFDGEYITWTTDGANAGTVFYHNGKFNCTNVCGTLKIIDNLVRPFYLYLLLELIAKKYVSKNLGNPKLMNGVMGDIQISIPSQLIQDKYVETIKTINDKIANENEILEHYYVMKRFLLKNLFI